MSAGNSTQKCIAFREKPFKVADPENAGQWIYADVKTLPGVGAVTAQVY